MPGNDSYTKLLVHFDGDDESVTIPDSSVAGQHGNATVVSAAQLDIAQKKFGTASLLLLDGADDCIYWGDSADWNMGVGRLTIDFWVRIPDVTTNHIHGFFHTRDDLDNQYYFRWDGPVNAGHNIRFRLYNVGMKINEEVTWDPLVNTWYHIAVIRGWNNNNDDWAITVGGTAIHTFTNAATWPDLSDDFTIGQGLSTFLKGWIDEFRVSKGIARWTEDFTPPTSAYSASKINIGDSWRDIEEIKINIGDSWKNIAEMKINIGDTWKDVF